MWSTFHPDDLYWLFYWFVGSEMPFLVGWHIHSAFIRPQLNCEGPFETWDFHSSCWCRDSILTEVQSHKWRWVISWRAQWWIFLTLVGFCPILWSGGSSLTVAPIDLLGFSIVTLVTTSLSYISECYLSLLFYLSKIVFLLLRVYVKVF